MNGEILDLVDALEKYEMAFEETFLAIQREHFGVEKMDFFLEIPCVKSDWKQEVRKSFLKMGLEWAYVDLSREAQSYNDWIEHEIQQYNACACHGRGCNSCLC